MKRLTHGSPEGKRGIWSPNKKEELVEALAAYESTKLSPREINEIISAAERDDMPQIESITYFEEGAELGIPGVDLVKLTTRLYTAISKLRAYEDTGLAPEDIRNIRNIIMNRGK